MAPPRYKDKDIGVVLSFNGQWVSWTHTAAAYAAFLSALVVGVSLHYHKIVQNEWYGYPQEWFPSVSATIGDRYPERSIFMIFIAVTSGPRFALVGLWYLLTARPGQALPKLVAISGIIRTLTCGGWSYITSTDRHDVHDVLMISYLVFTIPWTIGCLALSPPGNPRAVRLRKYLAGAFFGTLVPMVYFFVQHKVHRVAGAYTIYAFFEWSLVLFDVAFDAVTALDFDTFEVTVRDVKGSVMGLNHLAVPAAVVATEKQRATAGLYRAGFTWLGMVDVTADLYHGFVFWSTLTSLGVTVWFFPLWYMGISGYEVLVLSTVSPLLLGIKPLRSLFVRYQHILHLLSLAGLVAYQVQTPTLRLFTVGVGVALSCLAWAVTFCTDATQPARLESRILALILGLILSSTAKFAWCTLNPIWPIVQAENGGWNGTGLALAMLAALRFTRRGAPQGGSTEKVAGSALLSACSVAGLFFGLHSLLTDSSTMILWVWEGYPVRGPVWNVHAWFTIAAMTGGLLASIYRSGIVTSWATYGAACVGARLLTLSHGWRGYYGALVLAVYLTAISVPLLSNAARKNPAVTFGVGFLIYNFMVLFHVWVLAYAFVPGGPLVREHTDWVMIATMLLLGAGVFDVKLQQPKVSGKKLRHQQQQQDFYRRRPTASPHRKYHLGVLGVLNLLFLAATFFRFPTNDYKPYHPEERAFTAGIWTIHFSLDNDMWSSERRVASLLRELELDVVGLLETDCQHIIMGNRDPQQALAEELGMYLDYGPGPHKHTWGAALLSRFPIVNSTHHLLPSPHGELAPAIHATINAYDTLVDVFVFHSGQEEDDEDRRLQAEYLSKLMGSVTNRPAILLSYLVTEPLQGNYNTYVSDASGMHDVDPSDSERWCEYILYKGLRRTGYARVSRSTITDTELQVAKFVVPHAGDDQERGRVWGATEEERVRRVPEGKVPEGLRFPEMFRGDGLRGHRYHVFDEPRYYGF